MTPSVATHCLVVRHAESEWNASGRWQGWADPPLTALGNAQAASAATSAILAGVGAIVTSDLRRARRTAEIIATLLGLPPPAVDPRLRERCQGAWTGLTRAEITHRFPGALKHRPRQPFGGERVDTVVARALEAIHSIARRQPGQRVLVLSHSGLIRLLEGHLSVEAPAVDHLAGRWITVTDAAPPALRPGARVGLRDLGGLPAPVYRLPAEEA